jgi:hypothetical protein
MLLLLASLAASTGCVFADGARFTDTMGVCQARILHVPPPPGQYEEIGFVTVTGGALASVETTRAALQQKACELGADAVYVAEPGYGTCNAWELAYVDIDGVLLKSVRAAPPSTAPEGPPAPMDG